MTKTKYDNDATDRIGVVQAKNDIENLRPIKLGAICDEIKENNYVVDLPRAVYSKK